MDKKKAMEILRDFNEWRRGKPPYDKPGTTLKWSPEEIGEAIDLALDHLAMEPDTRPSMGLNCERFSTPGQAISAFQREVGYIYVTLDEACGWLYSKRKEPGK